MIDNDADKRVFDEFLRLLFNWVKPEKLPSELVVEDELYEKLSNLNNAKSLSPIGLYYQSALPNPIKILSNYQYEVLQAAKQLSKATKR